MGGGGLPGIRRAHAARMPPRTRRAAARFPRQEQAPGTNHPRGGREAARRALRRAAHRARRARQALAHRTARRPARRLDAGRARRCARHRRPGWLVGGSARSRRAPLVALAAHPAAPAGAHRRRRTALSRDEHTQGASVSLGVKQGEGRSKKAAIFSLLPSFSKSSWRDMSDNSTRTLILASSSPRRKALLEQLGIRCEVRPVDIDESMREGETPRGYVERLALEKARAAR